MDTMGHIPGLPGLFVVCVFSGALSTLSSGYNALATVTWDDFFKVSQFSRKTKNSVVSLLLTFATFPQLESDTSEIRPKKRPVV